MRAAEGATDEAPAFVDFSEEADTERAAVGEAEDVGDYGVEDLAELGGPGSTPRQSRTTLPKPLASKLRMSVTLVRRTWPRSSASSTSPA